MNVANLAKALINTPSATKGLTRGAQPGTFYYGVVQAIDTVSVTITITLAGSSVAIPLIAYAQAYVPSLGDTVIVLKIGSDLLVLDTVAS